MADENEPKQRVRYCVPVTVGGVTYGAGSYEAEVSAATARDLIAAGRAIPAATHSAILAAKAQS